MEVYYMSLLLLLFFFYSNKRHIALIYIVVTIVLTEQPLYSLIEYCLSGFIDNFYVPALVTESVAILVLMITHKYHQFKWMLLPFTLSLMFNMLCYTAEIDGYIVSDEVYSTVNLLLYELIIFLCIRTKPIKRRLKYCYLKLISNLVDFVYKKTSVGAR